MYRFIKACTALKSVDNAIRDARLLVLRHTLGYPHDVADLLFPQLHVRVEGREVELLLKAHDAAFDLQGGGDGGVGT